MSPAVSQLLAKCPLCCDLVALKPIRGLGLQTNKMTIYVYGLQTNQVIMYDYGLQTSQVTMYDYVVVSTSIALLDVFL
ncbi:coronin-1A [Biomphalaria glabrata]|nr:Biomphalaria glabrata coronin-1A-like [Biomphalaria glabrata]